MEERINYIIITIVDKGTLRNAILLDESRETGKVLLEKLKVGLKQVKAYLD